MKIDAKVQSISKLKDYFFLVPDYQREYVWKPDDEVEQFLIDIENEYSPDAKEQYNRGIQMYRFPNSDVQKSVIFEGIKKRLKIV